MNNQPGSNGEGYLAAQKLPVAMIQHCRIEPVLNPALVRMVNQRANAVIAVPDSVHQVLLTHGVAAEKCVTVFNAIDIRQSLPIRETMRQQLLTVQPKTFFWQYWLIDCQKVTSAYFAGAGEIFPCFP